MTSEDGSGFPWTSEGGQTGLHWGLRLRPSSPGRVPGANTAELPLDSTWPLSLWNLSKPEKGS